MDWGPGDAGMWLKLDYKILGITALSGPPELIAECKRYSVERNVREKNYLRHFTIVLSQHLYLRTQKFSSRRPNTGYGHSKPLTIQRCQCALIAHLHDERKKKMMDNNSAEIVSV